MNEETKNADTNETATSAVETKTEETTINPVKKELEKVKSLDKKTEAEKASFSLKKIAERLRELGGDPKAVLGFDSSTDLEDEDDNAPVTVGMLKKIESDKAQKTSLQLAESITDPDEQELIKHYLKTRIVPSGDPHADLRDARSMVNSIKNSQIAEEVARTANQGNREYASSTGAPAKREENFEPTLAEQNMMQSFKLTKEDVLKARQAEQAK